MKVSALVIVCLVSCNSVHGESLGFLPQLRKDLVTMETNLWTNILDPRWNEVTDTNSQGPNVAVSQHFVEFDEKLKKLERDNPVDEPVEKWWVWLKVNSERNVINSLYQSFRVFIKRHTMDTLSSQAIWLDMAGSIINNSTGSIPTVIDRLYNIVLHGHLFRELSRESDSHVCELQQSKHQLLYNLYDTLLLTEIKGYAMMQFSWMILKLYGKGNFVHEADISRERYEERTAITVASLKSSLEGVSRQFWRCDPHIHVEGETYAQLTRLLQGYIENEVDMNSEGTCRETCGYYQHTKNYGCFKDQFCSRQPACTGNIHSCRFVDSDMWICLSKRYSNRRYDWVEYESGDVYGKYGKCDSGTIKVDSWWRWALYHCSYCVCLCDEQSPKSDRFFSLKDVMADVQQNKVITGLRLIKMNRVIHLQISQGKLLPGAIIDTETVNWLTVEPINLRSAKINVDYHQLSYEQRGIDLDDLEGATDHLLTGVRFRKLGTHVNFEIHVTPFNYTTGNLDPQKSIWIGNDNTNAAVNKPRQQLRLENPDIPTLTIEKSTIDSHNDQYINFDHSDFKADFAQTTIPFIDTQPVMPKSPVPLSGAGIYHKGKPKYGGFIAPKVFTYDFVKHVDEIHFGVGNDNNNDAEVISQ